MRHSPVSEPHHTTNANVRECLYPSPGLQHTRGRTSIAHAESILCLQVRLNDASPSRTQAPNAKTHHARYRAPRATESSAQRAPLGAVKDGRTQARPRRPFLDYQSGLLPYVLPTHRPPDVGCRQVLDVLRALHNTGKLESEIYALDGRQAGRCPMNDARGRQSAPVPSSMVTYGSSRAECGSPDGSVAAICW